MPMYSLQASRISTLPEGLRFQYIAEVTASRGQGNHTSQPGVDAAVDYQMDAVPIREVFNPMWQTEIDIPCFSLIHHQFLIIDVEINPFVSNYRDMKSELIVLGSNTMIFVFANSRSGTKTQQPGKENWTFEGIQNPSEKFTTGQGWRIDRCSQVVGCTIYLIRPAGGRPQGQCLPLAFVILLVEVRHPLLWTYYRQVGLHQLSIEFKRQLI